MTDQEMRKLAAQQLRDLATENQSLREKVASTDKRDICIKIARKMVDKGLLRDNVEDFFGKVAELERHDNLGQYDAAVDIAVQGLSIGDASGAEKTKTESTDPVEALIQSEMTSSQV